MNEVVVLDDDLDVRVAVCEILEATMGVKCAKFASLAELQKSPEVLEKCCLALLDINLGPGMPSGLDAHDWLYGSGFKGKICFLTGHAQQSPMVLKASETGAWVHEKPVSTRQLCAIVQDAMDERRDE